MSQHKAIALTIAGSDCSAGAGIQADLKTFHDYGVHGLSAITSVVAETPLEVRTVSPMPVSLLQEQINILLETYPVNVIKIGLLPTRASVIAAAEIIQNSDIPSVIDPVMIASTGSSLADDEAAQALCQRLLPTATMITPNMPEASVILGRPIKTTSDIEQAARDISEKYGVSCLVKGGHLPNNEERLDVFHHQGTAHHHRHPAADLPKGIHGTGCTLSSAIAAAMARGNAECEAVASAIAYVQALIKSSYSWKKAGQVVHCLGW